MGKRTCLEVCAVPWNVVFCHAYAFVRWSSHAQPFRATPHPGSVSEAITGDDLGVWVKISPSSRNLSDKPGAWVDLALTLPIFLGYHLGVVFLKVKNASDLVTGPLLELANGHRENYLGITVAVGVFFAGIFALLGRGHAFRLTKFVQIAVEGGVYAVAMRIGADYLVGRLSIGASVAGDPLSGVVMSMGAGFYEELAFRVILFGLGAKVLVWLVAREAINLVERTPRLTAKAILIVGGWGIFAAAIFSGVHYVGPFGDKFELGSFAFRLLLGLALTLIFGTRGFAAAVWAHALYDVWVLVL